MVLAGNIDEVVVVGCSQLIVILYTPLQANAFLLLYTASTHKISNAICWLQPSFLVLAVCAYWGSSPIMTDNASCFNASQCSIHRGTADFLKYTFSEVAVFPESHGSTL